MSNSTTSVKVWDPIVRIGHWTLVIAFFTAYFTEDELMAQHVWAGYVVASVVILRLLWGIVGSKHARFNDFVYRPSAVLGYLKGLMQKKPQHYEGHNPAGGAMVIALLLSIAITVYTGLALYAVEDNAGPLVSLYSSQTNASPAISSSGEAHENESQESEENEAKERTSNMGSIYQTQSGKITLNDKVGVGGTGRNVEMNENQAIDQPKRQGKHEESFLEELHGFFANFTLFLVILHIGGVILSSRIDKENLVKAMITGKKELV
ncbi:MAG: cytochrome b/b6 domain-containing protein [Methylophilus sp.]|nr:cytochrome b/b6 domain-containing protein [Methylophilus sp.]